MLLRALTAVLLCLLLIAPASKGQAALSDTVDILHYDIHLDLVYLSQKSLSGHTGITLVPVLPSIQSFTLQLLGLQVDSVRSGSATLNYQYDDTLLTVFLPAALTSSDTALVEVYYQGQPVVESYGWGGFHFANDSSLAYNLGIAFYDDPHNYGRVWFPCIDEFTERAAYDYHIRVKDPKVAVCSGYLVSQDAHPDNTTTYHWRLEQTIPAYLASVAVSDYSVVSDTLSSLSGALPADLYVPAADTAKARASFANLQQILSTFESRFGPYRWPRIGFVSTPQGAMEHACNIATPSYMLSGNTSYEWLFAHELSHHWFGDLVTCASAADMWMNEGWAVFCEAVTMEGLYGTQAYKDYARDNHEKVLQFAHTPQGDGSWMALYGIDHEHTYGTTVYDKGGSVTQSLRGYLGDSLFFASVRTYLDRHAFSHQSSAGLRDSLSLYSGIDLHEWFDTWVFAPGFIHYSIDSVQVHSSALPEYRVTVFLRQKLRGPSAYMQDNRVPLAFMRSDWSWVEMTAEFDGITDSVSFLLPFEPLLVMLDPEERILDATLDHYKVIRQTGLLTFDNLRFNLDVKQLADSAFVRVTHHWVAPDAFQVPIPGLSLSTQRYWSVEGIFPAGFSADGQFFYSRSNYLDNDILTSNQDSLVILYRPGAGSPWMPVGFVQLGVHFAGRLIVPDLQPGDYALAVWDQAHLGMADYAGNPMEALHAFPNPSQDTFTISLPLKGAVRIFNQQGKVVYFKGDTGPGEHIWNAGEEAAGRYHVVFSPADTKTRYHTSIILVRP